MNEFIIAGFKAEMLRQGYTLAHYGDSEEYGIYAVREDGDTIYTVELLRDGVIWEYRRGVGKGCLDVLDGIYKSLWYFCNGIHGYELEKEVM